MGRHGENIHKRKDGRWEARVIVSDSCSGKSHYRYLYGKSYQEAKEKRNFFWKMNLLQLILRMILTDMIRSLLQS